MKFSLEYDAKLQRPRAVLEAEDEDESDQLRQIVAFPVVTFAVVVDEDEEFVLSK